MRSIAIDIGNTRIKAGYFEDRVLKGEFIALHVDVHQLKDWCSAYDAEHLIHASTAAESFDITAHIPDNLSVTALNAETLVPLEIDYDRQHLGLDRLANAVAGHQLCPEASLVIDAGTCITYDWTVAGRYLGGGISPGLHLRYRAMHSFTGRLPLITVPKLGSLIGKDTEAALNSGAYHGFILEVRGVISAFLERYPQGAVYLTGGDSELLAEPIENDIFADPFLTLFGLNAILENLHA